MEKNVVAPTLAPLNVPGERGEERWRHFDNSGCAVSFGFVATAILISMFLVMAIFERFLRPHSELLSSDEDGACRDGSSNADLEGQPRRSFAAKLDYPSPTMSVYSKGVSVLMPGHDIPTFIAHPIPVPAPAPAPVPCAPERNPWPSHQPIPICGPELSTS